MPEQDELARVIDRGIAEGLDDAELRLLAQDYYTSKRPDTPLQGFAGIRVVSDEEWAQKNTGQKVIGVLEALGRGFGASFLGGPQTSEQVFDNPGTTLAGAALPTALGAASRYGRPAVRSAISGVARALDKPAVGGAVGAAEGYRRDGLSGAVIGGIGGAAGSSKVAQFLRRLGLAAPTASARMVAGMSQAGQAAPPAPAPPSTLDALLRGAKFDELAPMAAAAKDGRPATPAVPSAARTAAPVNEALARELLAREQLAAPIKWETTDVSRWPRPGKNILFRDESTPGLSIMLKDALLKNDRTLVSKLEKALRQRAHITGKSGN